MSSLDGVLDPADVRPDAERSLRDWLSLQWDWALDPVAAAALLRAVGSPAAALRAPTAKSRRDSRPDPEALAATLRRIGARALPLDSPAYPRRLARLADPPLLLSIRGDIDALAGPCVGIVGSRAATVYGLTTAEALAADFARAGAVVVSGLALGIDAAAHRGALAAGGRTVAILACGPDRIYPARHRGLAEQIVRDGAIVSELPVGTAPLRAFFPLRNRLISGLSAAVVIVEARERSGSLITARHAADQGVDVFAVPGPIHAPTSAGPNRLLQDGAGVVLEASDVLQAVGLEPVGGAADAAPESAPPDAQGPGARSLLAELTRAPATRDELSRRTGRAPSELALDLLELEWSGVAALDRDGRWRRTQPRR